MVFEFQHEGRRLMRMAKVDVNSYLYLYLYLYLYPRLRLYLYPVLFLFLAHGPCRDHVPKCHGSEHRMISKTRLPRRRNSTCSAVYVV
jgi:hypothetical protein